MADIEADGEFEDLLAIEGSYMAFYMAAAVAILLLLASPHSTYLWSALCLTDVRNIKRSAFDAGA
jgi:hypothetical protein